MAALTCFPPASADDIGGYQGWYVIHCNVYGANIYLDDKFVGTAPMGALTVPVPINGTPYKKIRVQKYGYSTFVDSITTVPVKGDMVDLYAILKELPPTTPAAIIGDVGWYIVHCNVDGATVLLDETEKGEISQGVVYVPVYSTATPFHSYTVKKDGYTSFTGTIDRVPLRGESVDLYVSINPADTPTVTPMAVGGDIGWYNVHANVDGATVTFDNDVKGKTAKGTLSVQVFVTGTPYRAFTVYKAGYVPYTGTIGNYPAKGQTVDLYATLNAEPATTAPTPVPTTKSPLNPAISGIALILGGVCAMLLTNNRK
ncbi:MAG: PEGA domain-containing protein [Methanoregula sp.]|nr:PEGA domain-containing protein [Methanoregula sp.]